MGVPGFFSWLLKEYDNKNSGIIIDNIEKEDEIGTLYLDANCLFHPQCFKILDYFNKDIEKEVDKEELEKYMFERIKNYIQYLIDYVDPTNVHICVDGVAPMAKISQQRSRRYKSVEDKKIINRLKMKYNCVSKNDWSNIVISPGTEFMKKLDKHLLEYVESYNEEMEFEFIKYSSYKEAGEGEHKILEIIRTSNKKGKDIIYGLDADLLFLSLSALSLNKNIENIYLLREKLIFGHKDDGDMFFEKDPIKDVEEDLSYVSIKELRNTLNHHLNVTMGLRKYKEKEARDFSLDFIFLCFFLGNDFIPHVPSVNIKKGSLNFILNCYANVYCRYNKEETLIILGDNNYKINIDFFGTLLRYISNGEKYYFEKIIPSYEKRKRTRISPYNLNTYEYENWSFENLMEIDTTYGLDCNNNDFKEKYYERYLGKNYKMRDVENMCHKYLESMVWVAEYYFNKCCSWSWTYGNNNGPFLSDVLKYYNKINDNDINKFEFEMNKPLRPCEQLAIIIPPYYKEHIPKKYRKVHYLEKIIRYFPPIVEIDYLYKDMEWQGVAMLEHINYDEYIEELKNID